MEQAYCDALKTAIEFERNGEAFYRQLIGSVSDPFAKKVLVFLADEEVDHINKIEMFNDSLLGKSEFDFETECNLELPDRVQALVQAKMRDTDKNVSPESDDLDIYDVAIALEARSRELYEQALNETDNERVETFFRFLLAEEREHYDLLASSKRYLSDPSYYFEEYGGWIFG
ncbi:MAG: ferritin family protein [Actinobacteria bacterium]|nr:ferritin family protein [Actinomycetota bacterium]